MKRILLFLFVLALGLGIGFRWGRRGQSAGAGARKVLYWVDPMHPAYKSDKPGIAPDCGMKLVPVYADGSMGPIDRTPAVRKILYYRDPKNPKYTQKQPGLNPETGNELVPVYEARPEPMPSGAFRVSLDKQQLIGVQYGTASIMTGAESIRAVGRVAQDETRLTRVHPRIEGWITKTLVDYPGQLVHKGDPLLTLYSPEMLSTEQELLLAIRARDEMKAGPLKEAWGNSEMLVDAARRRLELFDLSALQTAEIERTRTPIRSVTLYSPATGYVTARNAYPSQRVTPETELYTLSDLSRVWIVADVFETDISRIREGQSAVVTLASGEARPFNARVNYIQPQVDPQTRTLKVRLDAGNAGMRLKPDMFVNVQFAVAASAKLTVPADAVVDTGTKQTVYVDRGNGYLEPRAVEIGEHMGDRIEIRHGLKPDERIVSSGTFLIDSESRLQPVGQAPVPPGAGSAQNHDHQSAGTPAAPPAHAGHGGHAQ